MPFQLKRRFFRFYLRLRLTLEGLEVRTFVTVFRLVTQIHILPSHVRRGSYDHNGRPSPPAVRPQDITDLTIKVAESMFETSRSRITSVAGKVGTLLTVTGIAVSGTLASLSMLGIPSSIFFYILFPASVIIFVCAGWFMFKFLAVGQSAALSIDANFLKLSAEKEKAELVNSLLAASANNDRRTDFLVDVYKAARILCGLTCLSGLIMVTLAVRDRIVEDNRLIMKLRSDPALIELLRGTKGERGAQGTRGQPGPPGKDGTIFVHWIDIPPFNSAVIRTSEDALWLLRIRTSDTPPVTTAKPVP